MERSAVATTSSEFVRWEEIFVSSDKGRREAHYYLERRNGTADLAVVGKETSLRHMSYHYAIRDPSLLLISPRSSLLKLRSRREVIDWLDSIVSASSPEQPSQVSGGSLVRKDACKSDVETLMDVSLRKRSHFSAEFLWLGSPWTCRKRRRHYKSFCRNGVKISVHDFVFVLAEEDKRLIAYLDDMYEDSRGNKMVVVQWFHKTDEVGTISFQSCNEREIFFSLCLQDLNIECIDGLATVLSPQHYEKFVNGAKDTRSEPFLCNRQFDNDDVKPFDITQLKGYWRQPILRNMYAISASKDPIKSKPSEDGLRVERNTSEGVGIRPKKRLRRLKDTELSLRFASKLESTSPCLDMHKSGSLVAGGMDVSTQREGGFAVPGKQAIVPEVSEYLTVGSQVEVLSQDSGLRGCWFRVVILKKHKDKVKVRYQDIKDADDEASYLEEWVLASKFAIPDQLGLRLCDRTTIRPVPQSKKGNISLSVSAGAVVDVWWHDGWWEGIVLQKETDDKLRVYFPGEKRESIFGSQDLRCSQEWLSNKWEHIKDRPDLVTSILSGFKVKPSVAKANCLEVENAAICDTHVPCDAPMDGISGKDEVGNGKCQASPMDNEKELRRVRDLSKDALLAQLKWRSSGKRSRLNLGQKQLLSISGKSKNSPEAVRTSSFESFFISNSMKVDHDNCKYIGNSLFSSSVVSPLTNLVMSR